MTKQTKNNDRPTTKTAKVDLNIYKVTPAQRELLPRVMSTSGFALDDLLKTHADYASVVAEGLISATSLRARLKGQDLQMVTGLLKLAYGWGVRAHEEDWVKHYEAKHPDGST